MKYLFNSFIILILLSSCQNKDSVDLIIHGGSIYTVDSTNSKVESVALRDGLIYQTGDFNKIISLRDQNTEMIDLNGRTMIPGFIEGHGHIMGTGYNQKNIDLLNTSSYDEIIEIIKNKSNEINEG